MLMISWCRSYPQFPNLGKNNSWIYSSTILEASFPTPQSKIFLGSQNCVIPLQLVHTSPVPLFRNGDHHCDLPLHKHRPRSPYDMEEVCQPRLPHKFFLSVWGCNYLKMQLLGSPFRLEWVHIWWCLMAAVECLWDWVTMNNSVCVCVTKEYVAQWKNWLMFLQLYNKSWDSMIILQPKALLTRGM